MEIFKDDKNEVLFLECACYSDEHTLKFRFIDSEEEYPELYTSVFLNNEEQLFELPYWFPKKIDRFLSFVFIRPITRLWIATKYVFGYKCKYGHWDCFSMRPEQADDLIRMLQKYKSRYESFDINGLISKDEEK